MPISIACLYYLLWFRCYLYFIIRYLLQSTGQIIHTTEKHTPVSYHVNVHQCSWITLWDLYTWVEGVCVPLQTLNAPTRMEDAISDNSYQHYYSCWRKQTRITSSIASKCMQLACCWQTTNACKLLPSVMVIPWPFGVHLCILQILSVDAPRSTRNELHHIVPRTEYKNETVVAQQCYLWWKTRDHNPPV